jgi:hypothetical protein
VRKHWVRLKAELQPRARRTALLGKYHEGSVVDGTRRPRQVASEVWRLPLRRCPPLLESGRSSSWTQPSVRDIRQVCVCVERRHCPSEFVDFLKKTDAM